MSGLEARLRIAFVSDMLHGPLGGGITAGRYAIDRLRQEHHVVAIASDARPADGVRVPGFQVPVAPMRGMSFVMARPDRGARAALAAAIARVDLVHLQLPFWLSFAALEEARRAGKPVVAAFHVQPENLLHNLGLRAHWMRQALYRLWVERLYNRADAVVCPTRFAERKLREHGLRAPAFVVSNGVPPDLAPATTEREPAHEGAFLVLMVGRLAVEKRQDVMLEALRRSRYRDRIQLVLAGAGPCERALRKKARGLARAPEIGFVPRERLARLLSTADLFVHASEVELEGIAVLEAMSKGLPVLVAQSPESAASEFAAGEAFRFPAGDPVALAAKLDALIERPHALARAREHYTQVARTLPFEESIRALERVYRTVLGWDGMARRPALLPFVAPVHPLLR